VRAETAQCRRCDVVRFASNAGWIALHSATGAATASRPVCLSSTVPANCPAGAVNYGFPAGGWTADLSGLPTAKWIWGGGINGSTFPSEDYRVRFLKAFVVQGSVRAANIKVAADDAAKVWVNGQLAGEVGSTTDFFLAQQAQASLRTFNIAPFLKTGVNVLEVRATNGPGWFAGCSACTYAQNPAGVVFGGFIESCRH
jgi:hypothetical protein